jgi:hypothetical protein
MEPPAGFFATLRMTNRSATGPSRNNDGIGILPRFRAVAIILSSGFSLKKSFIAAPNPG